MWLQRNDGVGDPGDYHLRAILQERIVVIVGEPTAEAFHQPSIGINTLYIYGEYPVSAPYMHVASTLISASFSSHKTGNSSWSTKTQARAEGTCTRTRSNDTSAPRIFQCSTMGVTHPNRSSCR